MRRKVKKWLLAVCIILALTGCGEIANTAGDVVHGIQDAGKNATVIEAAEDKETITIDEFLSLLREIIGEEPDLPEDLACINEEAVSRGEAVVVVMKVLGLYQEASHPFIDISDDEVACAVSVAYNGHMIDGISETEFAPDLPISLLEARTLTERAVEYRSRTFDLREEATNTITLQKNVVMMEEESDQNHIINIDQVQKQITISDPDKEIKKLKEKDVLYLLPGESFPEGLVAKVTHIDHTDNALILTCEEPTLVEVFADIDISTEIPVGVVDFSAKNEIGATSSVKDEMMTEPLARDGILAELSAKDGVLAELSAENGVLAELSAKNGASADSAEKDGKKSDDSKQVDWKDLYQDYAADSYRSNGGRTWSVYAKEGKQATVSFQTDSYEKKKGAYASMDLALTLKIDFQMIAKNMDIQHFHLMMAVLSDVDGVAGYAVSADSGKQKIELPSCKVPVCGPLNVEIAPYLEAKANGEFQVEAQAHIHNRSGFFYSNETKLITMNDTTSSAGLDASASGSMEAGIGVDVEAQLAGTKFFDGVTLCYADVTVGLLVDGETSINQKVYFDDTTFQYRGNQNTADENGRLHSCFFCVEGTCNGFVDLEIGLGEDFEKALNTVFEGIDLSYSFPREIEKICDWHFSTGEGYTAEFESRKCPHLAYETTVAVVEKESHMPMTGIKVTVDGKTLKTDEQGETIWYLASGAHDIVAENKKCDPKSVSESVTVEDSRQRVTVEMVWAEELPYCVYGSHIVEYKGVMYGYPFEDMSELGYGGFKVAYYGDRVYCSTCSAGTSELSTALYSYKLDGTDRVLLDEFQFVNYSAEEYENQYDCSNFVICDGICYYDCGKKCIHLDTGEKEEIPKSRQNEKFREMDSWRYDNKTGAWYHRDHDTIVKIKDGKQEVVYYAMRDESLSALDAITDDALYFESYWSEFSRKYLSGNTDNVTAEDYMERGYLWKMDLSTGKITEIDSHVTVGGGAYYNQ